MKTYIDVTPKPVAKTEYVDAKEKVTLVPVSTRMTQDVYRAARKIAFESGISIQQYLEDAVRVHNEKNQ